MSNRILEIMKCSKCMFSLDISELKTIPNPNEYILNLINTKKCPNDGTLLTPVRKHFPWEVKLD